MTLMTGRPDGAYIFIYVFIYKQVVPNGTLKSQTP